MLHLLKLEINRQFLRECQLPELDDHDGRMRLVFDGKQARYTMNHHQIHQRIDEVADRLSLSRLIEFINF